MHTVWIPFWQWDSWTPQQRGEVTAFYESRGQAWAIDLTRDRPRDIQADKDEYREEMSIGGKRYRE